MTIIWITAGAALLFVGFVLLARNIIFRVYTKPPRLKGSGTPATYNLEFENLTIEANGTEHIGWLMYPPGYKQDERTNLVIIPHGFSAEKSDVLPRCAAVAEAGFLVYTFDWRAHGESPAERCSGGLLEVDDLAGIVEYFQSQSTVASVGLYGYSMAAAFAILVAVRNPAVPCVIADSPFDTLENAMRDIISQFPMGPSVLMAPLRRKFKSFFKRDIAEVDVVAAVPELSPRPLLLLTGTADKIVRHDLSMAVYSAAEEPKMLRIQSGGGHFDNASTYLLNDVIIPFLHKHMPMVKPGKAR